MAGGGSAAAGWDFFVSYAQADQAWAEWTAWQLEDEGYRVLVQAWDMVAGVNWVHRMHEGVQRAERTVAVLSPAYMSSVYGTAEWQAAWRGDPLGERRGLLVVRIADCIRPGLLASVVGVDVFGVSEAAARQVLRTAVQQAVRGRAKPEGEPAFPAEGRTVPVRPRFPGALPAVWNVPVRNPNFTGRSSELERIQTGLVNSATMTVQALHGMGGVGKTQTAMEYAHCHASGYDLVWWLAAEQPALLAEQFAALADQLGLPSAGDPAAAVRVVSAELRRRHRWLLIFDNAEAVEDIRPLLPGGAGHVLITTRRGGFRDLGGVLDLDVLDRCESVALLRGRAPALAEAEADAVAQRLGDLPLALAQAAAYLDQTGTPAGEYLGWLEARAAELHGRGRAGEHPDTIATVWSVSIQTLRAIHPAAVGLLELCAWLAPEPVPLDMFTAHPDQLPGAVGEAAADRLAFTEAVGALVDYSLARRTPDGLLLHRLVQDVTRHASDPGSQSLPVVLGLLRADLPEEILSAPENWPRWRQLLPHVLTATGHHDDTHPLAAEDASWLLGGGGVYLRTLGQPIEARPLHERALRIDEAVYGPRHPQVATDLSNLGWTLSELGHPAEAQPLHERALRIDEAVYGPRHPQVATDLSHLGWTLSRLGHPAEAQPLHERALRIREAIYGPPHPQVAIDLSHLGWTLSELGHPAEAQPLHERALRIREVIYGPDHPDVAIDLRNLGWTLRELGHPAEARPLHERALRIDEAVYGPHHPQVATDLSHLGWTLRELGHPTEAQPLLERALRIHQAVYGADHPKTVQSLSRVKDLAQAGSDDSRTC